MRKLLEKLAGLKKRAADKQAEIKDDMSPEAIRKIETEHGEIMAEITAVNAAIRALEESAEDSEDDPAPTPSADASARAADILSIGTRAGMETTAIETAIRDSRVTVDAFRTQAFEALAARSSANPTNPARVIRDEAETLRANLTEALSYRMGTPTPQAGVSEGARQFMEFGLIDVAARCIDYRPGSMSLSVRQIEDIFTRASHTTSDFPIIFEGSINRALEGRYALAQPTYRRIARKRNFRDFRPHTTVKLGDFPQLKKVLEDGEIKYGTFNEGKETVQAFSYAIALSVTRQMLINDELDAISDLLSSYGASVALFEEITFYASAFNGVLADTKTVFHADHNNLAGAGTVIDVDNVGKARAAMAKQKSLDNNPLLSNKPKILLTGPDKTTEAEKLIASITPATVSNVNIFSGRLDVVETSQITGNQWNLFADPSTGSNYRWGYLDGYEGPRVRMDEPFGRQGFAMSVELDFGCGATDFRFGYRNPGA